MRRIFTNALERITVYTRYDAVVFDGKIRLKMTRTA
jgi:hypothetical protein